MTAAELQALRKHFTVGDVISVKGPSVPVECEAYYFQVKEIWLDRIDLDGPYRDEACTDKVTGGYFGEL